MQTCSARVLVYFGIATTRPIIVIIIITNNEFITKMLLVLE